ncbi:hypothetical protein CMEL01_14143 [Colletotrichum melonis]|uniref:Uncharacterized protein n=1 Tax=Colletotrichum melonis TaxID=1209925 RepID=A0AAI9XW18_9PEZI|nr:hypothetical protein CMEL01_14143 [Colletotrichum melonis]
MTLHFLRKSQQSRHPGSTTWTYLQGDPMPASPGTAGGTGKTGEREKKRETPPPLNHFNQVRSGKTGLLADGRIYPAPTRVTSSNSPAGAVPAADLVPRLGRRLEAV